MSVPESLLGAVLVGGIALVLLALGLAIGLFLLGGRQ